MSISTSGTNVGPYSYTQSCVNVYDHIIKRGDTVPAFIVPLSASDKEDLEELALPLGVRVYLWFQSRLSAAISSIDSSISLLDNVGFDCVVVGDLVLFLDGSGGVNELARVTAIDVDNHTLTLSRGIDGGVRDHEAQIPLNIFRIYRGVGEINLREGTLTYYWTTSGTQTAGEYYFEFEVCGDGSGQASFPRDKDGYKILIQSDSYGG